MNNSKFCAVCFLLFARHSHQRFLSDGSHDLSRPRKDLGPSMASGSAAHCRYHVVQVPLVCPARRVEMNAVVQRDNVLNIVCFCVWLPNDVRHVGIAHPSEHRFVLAVVGKLTLVTTPLHKPPVALRQSNCLGHQHGLSGTEPRRLRAAPLDFEASSRRAASATRTECDQGSGS